MYLIDTDILVDYLRLHEPALNFLESFPKSDRKVAFISRFELLKGCTRKAQAGKIGTFMKHFAVLPMSNSVAQSALRIYHDKKWHAHIDIPDAFIAATALAHKLTLVTRNLKHYRNIPDLKVEKPY